MEITFYSTTDTPIKVNKSLTLIKTVTGTPINDMNIMNPEVTVSYDAALLNANMAYISTFGKYYFVNPPTIQTAQRMTISMHIDVLMTYRNSLRNCDALVIRSESVGPTNVPDRELPVDPNAVDIVSVMGTKGFDKLTAIGGPAGYPSVQTVLVTGRGMRDDS